MRWDVIGLVLGWTIRVVCIPLSVVGIFSFYVEGQEYAIKTYLIPLIIASLTLIAITFLGWIIRRTSLLANSKATRILRTFNPPPVEPAEAPTIINNKRTNWLKTGHFEKSAEEYPVLEIDMAWKAECLIVSKKPSSLFPERKRLKPIANHAINIINR